MIGALKVAWAVVGMEVALVAAVILAGLLVALMRGKK